MSQTTDHRERVVRSPHCPNRTHTCKSCAWGFLTPDGPGKGENNAGLALEELHMGYRSECGSVQLYRDAQGRIGAVRNGRFFPGIPGNFAYERYLTENPQLKKAVLT
ncbi:MAG TPA: hypothetical protein VMU25_03050 [Candidatus Paceibacterota bacterium]|nr:hypothetical protein [Candidatus Paceibacterota bacterium]